MRRRKGCRWASLRANPNLNPNYQGTNRLQPRNFVNRKITFSASKNYTYIGRCRCGYGPNAYYQDTNGKVIHASQLPKTSLSNLQAPSPTSVPSVIQKTTPPSIENYRICNRCGARVRDDAYFCTECGNELGDPSFLTKKDRIDLLKDQIKELKKQIKIIKKSDR